VPATGALVGLPAARLKQPVNRPPAGSVMSGMTPSRITLRRLAAGTAAAAAATMSGIATASPQHSTAPASAAGNRTAIATRHARSLGTFLVVAGSGRTIYLFEKDTRNHSTCTGACAQFWPPVTTSGRPRAKGAVKAGKLGRIRRGSTWQVTYGGHPLYTYSRDSRPGETDGQGVSAFGARWYVIGRKGHEISN
jgi:predicted lipoprotein with Yx(FWY)xxD motif